VTDPPLPYGNPILFAGYFHDNETGLYHVRHRMYSPTLQRWLQRLLRSVARYASNLYEYDVSRIHAPAWLGAQRAESGLNSIDPGAGETECDRKTGRAEIIKVYEHPCGHCVEKHERKHVAQLSECCRRVAKCIHSGLYPPEQCDAAYDLWERLIKHRFECQALLVEAVCIQDVLDAQCCGGKFNRCSQAQCDQMGAIMHDTLSRWKKECLLSYLQPDPPIQCPFDEEGRITPFVFWPYYRPYE